MQKTWCKSTVYRPCQPKLCARKINLAKMDEFTVSKKVVKLFLSSLHPRYYCTVYWWCSIRTCTALFFGNKTPKQTFVPAETELSADWVCQKCTFDHVNKSFDSCLKLTKVGIARWVHTKITHTCPGTQWRPTTLNRSMLNVPVLPCHKMPERPEWTGKLVQKF